MSHFWKVLQRTWRAVGTKVATHTDNRKKGEGGMATAALRGRLSSAINLHLIAFACAALRQPRLASVIGLVVSFTTVVPCSVRCALIFSREVMGEGEGKKADRDRGRAPAEEGGRRHIDGCGLCCGFYEIGLASRPRSFDIMCKTSEKATLCRGKGLRGGAGWVAG